uniref:Uncharacterized protein n=1 Tax=Lactuca sativa TaxID=4236 RepID=A0A9R1VKT7_LACSA|nr:hypothetical protein LSAT_V11C400220850 [Lactuca sativa]
MEAATYPKDSKENVDATNLNARSICLDNDSYIAINNMSVDSEGCETTESFSNGTIFSLVFHVSRNTEGEIDVVYQVKCQPYTNDERLKARMPMHEITFSTTDIPKLLCQVSIITGKFMLQNKVVFYIILLSSLFSKVKKSKHDRENKQQILEMKIAKKKKEDVLGILGEVHNVPHVSKEKMTPDVLVEGESSGSCFFRSFTIRI